MRHRSLNIAIIVIAVLGALTMVYGSRKTGSDGALGDPIAKIHTKIQADLPSVVHVTGDDVLSMPVQERMIFDVRKPEEFAVSHLAGAINIPPSTTAEEFMATYNEQLKGKTAVFYCSVGRRSSSMAARLDELGPDAIAFERVNIAGGIFRWNNENRPLVMSTSVKGDLPTQAVHPYNRVWGRLVTNKKNIKFNPVAN